MLQIFAKQFETFPEPDIKPNTIRIRVKNPNLFEQKSFRTIRLTSGVQAVIGKRKGQTSTSIQSLIFDKKKFTVEQAKNWKVKHKSQFKQAVNYENQKRSLFMTKDEIKNKIKEINTKLSFEVLTMEQKEIEQLKSERKQLLTKFEKFNKESIEEPKEEQPVPLETNKMVTFAKIFDERRLNEEEPKTEPEQPNQAVKDVLGLNEKLIMTLEKADLQIKDADQQIQALNQINNKLASDIQERENQLNAYKQAEIDKQRAQYEQKLLNVHSKWCEVFALKDITQQEEAKRMLSTFESEDKLETINAFLENKTVQMSDVPQQITRQSEELSEPVKRDNDLVRPQDLSKFNAVERKQYTDKIYQRMIKELNIKQ